VWSGYPVKTGVAVGEETLGNRFLRISGPVGLMLWMAVAARGAEPRFDAEAVRANNRGVAEMGQQFTERAEGSFASAFKKDPKLAQAAINDGIALLTLQKLDEAKKALHAALTLDPQSAQAWYNLGLAQHAGNELEPALESFRQAVKIDPRDVDSYYFEGVCLSELKDFDQAVDAFKQALAIDPNNAEIQSSLCYKVHFHPGFDRSGIFRELREWNRRHAKSPAPAPAALA